MSEVVSISVEGLTVPLAQIDVKGGTLKFIDDGRKGRRFSYIGLGAENEPLVETFDLSKFTISTIKSANLPVIIMSPHDGTQKDIHITLKHSDASEKFLGNIKTIEQKRYRRTESVWNPTGIPEFERKKRGTTMHLDKLTEEEIGLDALSGINLGDASIRNSDLSSPPTNPETADPEPLRTDGETCSSTSSDSERRGSSEEEKDDLDGTKTIMPENKTQHTKLNDENDDEDPNFGDTRL